MSSAYDQQIKKLVDHIQTLNQALHERNMQIAHWQQVARTVQDERARLARGLMDQVRQGLTGFSGRFQGLRSENKKLRTYIDHQKQLHEHVARDLQGQLQYALARIEELARERGDWRGEVNSSRVAALKYQQQVQEQKGVIQSQQAALGELRAQLEIAQGYAAIEEQLQAEIGRLSADLQLAQSQMNGQDQALNAKERQLRELQSVFETFKVRANEEVVALRKAIAEQQSTQSGADESAKELSKLLANSEAEIIKQMKEISALRADASALKMQNDSLLADNKKLKTRVTKLEKERDSAKSKQFEEMQKQLEEMRRDNNELQEALKQALDDKTQYMKAVEGQKGQKGKLRSLPPAADQET